MTVSMLTTRLSCGDHRLRLERDAPARAGRAAACTRSTNGITSVEARRERARVAAEALDDAGARLRDHAHGLRERDEHEEHDARRARSAQPRKTSYSATRAVAPSIWMTSTVCPSGEHLAVEVRARASTPRRRCAPGRRARRRARVTIALRPTSASVPVREIAGRRMCRRAIGRRIASEATEQTMKTISDPTAAGTEQRRERGRERRRARPGRGRRAPASASRRRPAPPRRTTQTSQAPSTRRLSRARVATPSPRRSSSRPSRPGSGPRGRRGRRACRPRVAPSTSSSSVSPTITASPALDVEQLEHAPEDRLVRLRLPVRARGEHRVDGQAVVGDEQVEVTGGVREQPELQAAAAQRVERRAARRRRARSGARAPRRASSRRRSRTCRRRRPCPR